MLTIEKTKFFLNRCRIIPTVGELKLIIAEKYGSSFNEDFGIDSLLIEKIFSLIKKIGSEERTKDWGAAESELVFLITEVRDTEEGVGIVKTFAILAEFLERTTSTVQYKYYKIKKRIDEGLDFQEAISMKRGQRGLGKRTLEERAKDKEESLPEKEHIPLLLNFNELQEERTTLFGEPVMKSDSEKIMAILDTFNELDEMSKESFKKIISIL